MLVIKTATLESNALPSAFLIGPIFHLLAAVCYQMTPISSMRQDSEPNHVTQTESDTPTCPYCIS